MSPNTGDAADLAHHIQIIREIFKRHEPHVPGIIKHTEPALKWLEYAAFDIAAAQTNREIFPQEAAP